MARFNKNMNMPLKEYKDFSPSSALVPGYFSLIVAIQPKQTCQVIRLGFGSVTSAFKVPHLPSALVLDLELTDGCETTLFYKWNPLAFAALKEVLVCPTKIPIKGKIKTCQDNSRVFFKAGFEIEDYNLENIGPGPLGHEMR